MKKIVRFLIVPLIIISTILLGYQLHLYFDRLDATQISYFCSGQVDEIFISPNFGGGYQARIVTDFDTRIIPLTVQQANSLKSKDLVDFIMVFDGWTHFKGISDLKKRNP